LTCRTTESASCAKSSDLEFFVSIATEGLRRVCITPLPARPKLIVEALSFPDGIKVEGEIRMTTMKATQEVTAGPVAAVDAQGNPALLDGPPIWTSSDETILTVEPAADGLNALIKAAGAVGAAQIRVDGDADTGAGVETLTAILEFEILAGKAVGLSVAVGTPVDQPAVTPQ
jgi:hypothetical protein